MRPAMTGAHLKGCDNGCTRNNWVNVVVRHGCMPTASLQALQAGYCLMLPLQHTQQDAHPDGGLLGHTLIVRSNWHADAIMVPFLVWTVPVGSVGHR